MGDTGSLSLGGRGNVAIIVKHEIVLAIIGGLCFRDCFVIIQVVSFKLTGKSFYDGNDTPSF